VAVTQWVGSAEAQSCFPGRALPGCRSFPVTEIGYAHRLSSAPLATGGLPQVHYLNGEIGWMFNRSPRLALGGTLFMGALVDYAFELRPGVKGRARYWLGQHTGLDLGAGVILGKVPAASEIGSGEARHLGANAHLGLSLDDALVLTAQLEYLPNPIDHSLNGYLGARIGSKPAAWTSLIVGPLMGLAAIVFSN
jgi:hypothetical protein